jgi:hypothetical protein
MARRWRLIAHVVVLGALILAFPAGGSALSAAFVRLTPSGPSPAVLTIPAGMYPVWVNNDQVTHAVSFANGLCSFQLAPGASQQCPIGFSVGQYAYTVDGATQGDVVVNALPPTRVTLMANSHTTPKGHLHLRLHGRLIASECCLPPPLEVRMPLVVLARHDRRHPFRRIATVRSETRTSDGLYSWRLKTYLNQKTIYIAKVTYQPEGEQGLRTSWSRPFKVLVRR